MNKGFTLIEMVVTMAVFLLVIGVSISIFISIATQQKDILHQQKILNQISYALEYMSKALRMAKISTDSSCVPLGYIYQLTRDVAMPDGTEFYQGVKFINQSDNNSCTEFFLEGGVLKEIKNNGTAVALTSTDLAIKYMRFGINGAVASYASGLLGATNGQIFQPRLTIIMNVSIQNTTKIIQTTISQRDLNAQ